MLDGIKVKEISAAHRNDSESETNYKFYLPIDKYPQWRTQGVALEARTNFGIFF